MQDYPCFVCGTVTNIYCKDVKCLRSKHTDTNILTYLEKFVGHDLSDDINRIAQSVVCQNCIIKIDEYDELYMNAMTLEEDLRTVLLKTLEQNGQVDDAADDTANDSEDVYEEIEEVTLSPNPSLKLPSMFCNICQSNFESFTELRNHEHIPKKTQEKVQRKSVEKNLRVKSSISAEVPPGTFINYDNVMIQKQPKFEQLSKATPTLKCSICNSMFFNKVAIKDHYKECHCDETRCDICGGLYPDKEKLKEHRERHTKTTNPLECVECNKIFKARNPLVRHMATHTLEKFFVCEFCGKQFTHHSSFKMHMMAHDDVREKKCEECGQLFRSTSHLNRHKRVHTNEKPYECLICHRLFAQRYNMMSHFKSHSKESQTQTSKKTHGCTICGRPFPTLNKLKEHCEAAHYVVDSIES